MKVRHVKQLGSGITIYLRVCFGMTKHGEFDPTTFLYVILLSEFHSVHPEGGGSNVLPKRWYPTTSLYGVKTQKTATWNPYSHFSNQKSEL